MMSTETHSLDIEALRADTPGCAHRAHLNNAGAALMSRSTLAAITGHLDLEARIGGYEAAEAAGEAIAGTYAGLARLVGGEPSPDRAVRQLHPRLERRLLLDPVPAG